MLDKLLKLNIGITEAKELINNSKTLEEDYHKLLEGYPIQYIIGYTNFYGYKINVNESVLIPRYETEYLVEKTIKYSKDIFKNKKIKILDLGTGSGCISIALSKELNSQVTAVDISNKALETAEINAKENDVTINFIKSDMLENVKEKFDIIISNPPYISKTEKIMDIVYKNEPHIALFAEEEGLYYYKSILSNAKKNLNKKFIIAFEIGYTQAHQITSIAKQYFTKEKILTEKDLTGKDRYIFIISE